MPTKAGAALLFAVLAGCHPSFAEARTSVASAQAAPPPFAAPPVLPHAPDLPALVAKLKPIVVNITTVHSVRAPSFDMEWPFGFFPDELPHRCHPLPSAAEGREYD